MAGEVRDIKQAMSEINGAINHLQAAVSALDYAQRGDRVRYLVERIGLIQDAQRNLAHVAQFAFECQKAGLHHPQPKKVRLDIARGPSVRLALEQAHARTQQQKGPSPDDR
jgi:hypothetical protein